MGRANTANNPVFYCSLSEAAAMNEMKGNLHSGETFYVSEWFIDFSEIVYAHSLIVNSNTINDTNLVSDLAKKMQQVIDTGTLFESLPPQGKEGIKQLMLKIGNLFALPGSECYNITSAYAHDVLYFSKQKGASMPILLYPSIASDNTSLNLAIHPEFVDGSMMRLNQVLKLKVKNLDRNFSVNVEVFALGKNEDDKIVWYKISDPIFFVAYDDVEILTYNNTSLKGREALQLVINGNPQTVEDFLNEELETYKETLPKSVPETDIFKFESRPVAQDFIIELGHGYEVETKSGRSCIKSLKAIIAYNYQLEKL